MNEEAPECPPASPSQLSASKSNCGFCCSGQDHVHLSSSSSSRLFQLLSTFLLAPSFFPLYCLQINLCECFLAPSLACSVRQLDAFKVAQSTLCCFLSLQRSSLDQLTSESQLNFHDDSITSLTYRICSLRFTFFTTNASLFTTCSHVSLDTTQVKMKKRDK